MMTTMMKRRTKNGNEGRARDRERVLSRLGDRGERGDDEDEQMNQTSKHFQEDRGNFIVLLFFLPSPSSSFSLSYGVRAYVHGVSIHSYVNVHIHPYI